MMGLIIFTCTIIGMVFGSKWVLTIVAILTGDKAGLHEAGCLCDDSTPLASSSGFDEWQRNWDRTNDWRNQGDPR